MKRVSRGLFIKLAVTLWRILYSRKNVLEQEKIRTLRARALLTLALLLLHALALPLPTHLPLLLPTAGTSLHVFVSH